MGTRDVILDAAAEVMRTRGLARATTKEIARAAGFSEATLYKHFHDKAEIFLGVLRERIPQFLPASGRLAERAGRETVAANLTEIATLALAFYHESFPMSASIFSEPDILAAHRDSMDRLGAGPRRPNEAVADYLRAEQALGRVRADADADAASALLLGACFQRAFLATFAQEPLDPAPARSWARALIEPLLP